jgi:large subunit ribosomal protein L25
MKKTILEAKKRDVKGKKARVQAGANIPAVIYGNGVKSEILWVDANSFEKMFVDAGTNTVIELTVDGGKAVNVLVYDYQLGAVSDEFTHIDFYAVNMKEKVEAEIPLVFVGVSPAVKELGGTLVKNNDFLVVKALPADLPHEIEIDLTTLVTFDDQIAVNDVPVNEKVEIHLDGSATIASVVAPRSEEEMAELDSEVDADVSNIEGVADKDDDENEEEIEENEESVKTEEK